MYLEKEKELFSLPFFSPLSAQLHFSPRAGPLVFPFPSSHFLLGRPSSRETATATPAQHRASTAAASSLAV